MDIIYKAGASLLYAVGCTTYSVAQVNESTAQLFALLICKGCWLFVSVDTVQLVIKPRTGAVKITIRQVSPRNLNQEIG